MKKPSRRVLSLTRALGLTGLCLSTSAVAGAQAQTPGSAATAPDLGSLPLPVIERLEDEVQSQLIEARQLVARLVETSGREQAVEALGALCRLYFLYELNDTAEPCLHQMQTLRPGDSQWHYYRATLHTSNGEIESAKTSLQRVLTLRPDHLPTLLRLGDLHLLTSDLPAAKEAFQAALDLEPGSSAARFGLGRVAIGQGLTGVGIDHFETALTGQPTGSVIHHHLGMAYRKQGDLERARQELEKNHQQAISFPDPLLARLETLNSSREEIFTRGVEARKQGRPRQAIQEFQRLLELEPEDPEARFNLARAQIEIGSLREAEIELREALEIWPGFFDAHFNLAVLLGRRGQEAEAALHLEEALLIDADHVPTRSLLARLLEQRGSYREAAGQFGVLVEITPGDPTSHLGRARNLLRAESYRQAHEALESSLGKLPEDRALRHLTARLLATCPDGELRDGARALVLAQSVVDDLLTLDHAETLAMALAELGRFREAAQWQRRVIQQELSMEGSRSPGRQRRLSLYEQQQPVRAPWLDSR